MNHDNSAAQRAVTLMLNETLVSRAQAYTSNLSEIVEVLLRAFIEADSVQAAEGAIREAVLETPREEALVREDEYSLEEVARIMNISPDRVRQIEAKALRRFRAGIRPSNVRDLLSDRSGGFGDRNRVFVGG